jgi:hypothetical protein
MNIQEWFEENKKLIEKGKSIGLNCSNCRFLFSAEDEHMCSELDYFIDFPKEKLCQLYEIKGE